MESLKTYAKVVSLDKSKNMYTLTRRTNSSDDEQDKKELTASADDLSLYIRITVVQTLNPDVAAGEQIKKKESNRLLNINEPICT